MPSYDETHVEMGRYGNAPSPRIVVTVENTRTGDTLRIERDIDVDDKAILLQEQAKSPDLAMEFVLNSLIEEDLLIAWKLV